MPEINIDLWTGLGYAGLIILIGVVATIKNLQGTSGPKERAFVARANLSAWVAIMLFFVAWYFTPHPYSYIVLLVYFAVFPLVVYRFCSKRLLIRRLERIHPSATGTEEASPGWTMRGSRRLF